MFERMLNKNEQPTIEQMISYCKVTSKLFKDINEWLKNECNTTQAIVFPYGNSYGWGISHKINGKLICNVFPENDSFTVMIRMTNKQFESIYNQVDIYTQGYIDNKYQCNNGGWIHYRVTNEKHFNDIKTILAVKCGLKIIN
jgi:hypothetical protein